MDQRERCQVCQSLSYRTRRMKATMKKMQMMAEHVEITTTWVRLSPVEREKKKIKVIRNNFDQQDK